MFQNTDWFGVLICCWALRSASCLVVSHTHGWRNDAKSEYTLHTCLLVVPNNLDWIYTISLLTVNTFFYHPSTVTLNLPGCFDKLRQAPLHHLLHSFPKLCFIFLVPVWQKPGSSNSPCALFIQQCQVRHLQFWMTMKAKLAKK